MKSLYTNTEKQHYTADAYAMDKEVQDFLLSIVKKYLAMGYPIRDIVHIMQHSESN